MNFCYQFLIALIAFPTGILGRWGTCKEPTAIYESLKCTPVYSGPAIKKCPSHFDCSRYEALKQAADNKCIFNGKLYNQGTLIDTNYTIPACIAGCFCSKNSEEMLFICGYMDCPRMEPPPSKWCHVRFDLNQCCHNKYACPPFNASCNVGGKYYKEGEAFRPPRDKCKTCVCQKGFSGDFVEPFCRKVRCTHEINHQVEIRANCAPSYISKEDCCTNNWICPEASDVIIPSKKPIDGQKCKFGDGFLNIGDYFIRENVSYGGKVSCECRIPPFLTCIHS